MGGGGGKGGSSNSAPRSSSGYVHDAQAVKQAQAAMQGAAKQSSIQTSQASGGDGSSTQDGHKSWSDRGMSPLQIDQLKSGAKGAAKYGLAGPIPLAIGAIAGYMNPGDVSPETAKKMGTYEARDWRTGGSVNADGKWTEGGQHPSRASAGGGYQSNSGAGSSLASKSEEDNGYGGGV